MSCIMALIPEYRLLQPAEFCHVYSAKRQRAEVNKALPHDTNLIRLPPYFPACRTNDSRDEIPAVFEVNRLCWRMGELPAFFDGRFFFGGMRLYST